MDRALTTFQHLTPVELELEKGDPNLTEEEKEMVNKAAKDPELRKLPHYVCPFKCKQPARCPWGCYIELQMKRFLNNFEHIKGNNIVVVDRRTMLAARKFKKTEQVLPYNGERLSTEEVRQLVVNAQDDERLRHELSFILQIADNVFINDIKTYSSCVSHQVHDCSCYPSVHYGKDGVPLVVIRAFRDIEAKEKLTMNYNFYQSIDTPLGYRLCDCDLPDCTMKTSY